MKKIEKILFAILVFLIGMTSVLAKPHVFERTEEHPLVNKKEILNESSIYNILNTPAVDANEKVYDFSDALTNYELNDLKERVNDFINKSKMDMVIVTINEYWNDQQIINFADDFFDYNDFGMKTSGKSYDGILVVRNTNDYNRYYYISTSGLGQIYFPKDRVDSIIDSMYNNMHNDNFYEGFVNFIDASYKNFNIGVPDKYKGCTVDKKGFLYDSRGNQISYEKGVYVTPVFIISIISFGISLITLIIFIYKNKMVKKAKQAKEYLDRSSIKINNKQDVFITTHTTSYKMSSSSSSGGGRSHIGSSGCSHGGGGSHC